MQKNNNHEQILAQLNTLSTEKLNSTSEEIDVISTLDKLKIINNEDKTVAYAIENELESIAYAVDAITQILQHGGRLIYLGAGTSGRLGILDAVECPPTYGISHELIVGVLAGGYDAVFKSKEGVEDSEEAGADALKEINFSNKDILCGIAASGRTPYVIGGLDYASLIGAKTIAFSCNKRAQISLHAEIVIEVDVGSEIISGSTRMKAGTAQKMVLNMLSTASMINLGKVYKNLMIDVQCSNQKLQVRAKRILMQACNVDFVTAENTLILAKNNVKTACVMLLAKCNYAQAVERLAIANGMVKLAIINEEVSDKYQCKYFQAKAIIKIV